MQSETVITLISNALQISPRHVEATIDLLEDGATIPFISRYRKEATGALDEVKIQAISDLLDFYNELAKRKETILKTIESQEKLTPELRERIEKCFDASELEDIYLPYKPKRHTRAEAAREKGLEPLAKIIMAQKGDDIRARAQKFVGEKVEDVDAAIAGAQDIIAEWISEKEQVRNAVRAAFRKEAMVTAAVVKGKEKDGANYRSYFKFNMPLRRCTSYQLLAIRRGESEGVLRVSININDDRMSQSICRFVCRGNGEAVSLVAEAACDSYKRLIRPSIENEFASLSKQKADEEAIEMFAQNLRQLLFAPPLGHKRVLAIDPGFRTGCKVVCLDEQGNLLHHDVIYPTPPKNDFTGSARKIAYYLETFDIQAIALGNGTASRETEAFLRTMHIDDVEVYVVSENGASIYSASKIAREEFPDEDVTVRGAVSIGRRLIDPLAELVKIDPKSIGVGQYQHDVDQTKLKHSLDFTVESCVNSVGVNVNTASKQLLTYVAGLGPSLAQNIINYRAENGDFAARKDILNVPRMGAKAFEQAAGFLRIPGAKNPLDNSAVHPESYHIVEQMAKDCGCNVNDLISNPELRKKIDINKYVSPTVGLPTLNDILSELEKPGRDPRAEVEKIEFDDNIHDIGDLVEGMVLPGIVTNITQFGAFVDIGLHDNGLIHISEMPGRNVMALKVHQHLKVMVKGIDLDRNRIALTLKNLPQ